MVKFGTDHKNIIETNAYMFSILCTSGADNGRGARVLVPNLYIENLVSYGDFSHPCLGVVKTFVF